MESTAKRFSNSVIIIQPLQVRKWRKEKQLLKKKENSNPKAVTVHSGKRLENSDSEQEIYNWIVEQI